jgi:hypothetical protein
VLWNADVALRGTGDLKKQFTPGDAPLNAGGKEWDKLWEMQRHIEAWRTLVNMPFSPTAARDAAKKIVLDDLARYRAESQSDGVRAPVPKDHSPTLREQKVAASSDSVHDGQDPESTAHTNRTPTDDSTYDDNDAPLILLGKRKQPISNPKNTMELAAPSDAARNHEDEYSSSWAKRRRLDIAIDESGRGEIAITQDRYDRSSPHSLAHDFARYQPAFRYRPSPYPDVSSTSLAAASPVRSELDGRHSITPNPAAAEHPELGTIQDPSVSSGVTGNRECLTRSADDDCDNIVVIKREPLPTPALTESALWEHGKHDSPFDPVRVSTLPAVDAEFKPLATQVPNTAPLLPLRLAFETPQRTISPAVAKFKHETVVIIDDEDDDDNRATIHGHDRAHLPHSFSQILPGTASHGHLRQLQASPREAEIRRLKRQLRKIEIEERLEALGGLDGEGGSGENPMIYGMP